MDASSCRFDPGSGYVPFLFAFSVDAVVAQAITADAMVDDVKVLGLGMHLHTEPHVYSYSLFTSSQCLPLNMRYWRSK